MFRPEYVSTSSHPPVGPAVPDAPTENCPAQPDLQARFIKLAPIPKHSTSAPHPPSHRHWYRSPPAPATAIADRAAHTNPPASTAPPASPKPPPARCKSSATSPAHTAAAAPAH